MKLLITGGHMSPALACVDEFLNQTDTQIVFVGRKYVNDLEKRESLEYQEIIKRKIPFIHLKAGRITRIFSFRSLISIFNIPRGFLEAIKIIAKEKPDAVLSFGGYIALPIAIASYLFRIPVYTHEQTIYPGLTNRLISRFAKKIFISFETSQKYFPRNKTILTGNPIRKQIFEIKSQPFSIDSDLPVLYVTGGSLGSHSINIHIKNILTQLLQKYIVIHQTGNIQEYQDYADLNKFKENLNENLKNRYYLREHFFDDEIGYIYSKADLVISRCGANTFSELIALQKPAVLVPLPWSAYKEQQRQAEILQKSSVAEIFDQTRESSELLAIIEKMMKNIKDYQNNFHKLSSIIPQNAEKTIVEKILQT